MEKGGFIIHHFSIYNSPWYLWYEWVDDYYISGEVMVFQWTRWRRRRWPHIDCMYWCRKTLFVSAVENDGETINICIMFTTMVGERRARCAMNDGINVRDGGWWYQCSRRRLMVSMFATKVCEQGQWLDIVRDGVRMIVFVMMTDDDDADHDDVDGTIHVRDNDGRWGWWWWRAVAVEPRKDRVGRIDVVSKYGGVIEAMTTFKMIRGVG